MACSDSDGNEKAGAGEEILQSPHSHKAYTLIIIC